MTGSESQTTQESTSGVETLNRIMTSLSHLSYKDWNFEAGGFDTDIWLRVSFLDPTTSIRWTSRKWRISHHATHSEIVQTVLKAVITAEEHETREQFLYRGRAIFAPHFDVDMLWKTSAFDNSKDERG